MRPLVSILVLGALAAPAFPASTNEHASSEPAKRDIVATAQEAGSFDILLQAVEAAGLTHVLRESGPFTVFAPTDAAFEALPRETVATLFSPEGKDQLVSILQYHVLPEKLDAAHVTSRRAVETLAGQRVDVTISDAGVELDTARIVSTDIDCANGVIHVIDSVLLPAQDDLVATAQSAGGFKTLLAACKAAGLVDTLRGSDPLTVLAPTDDAFGKLSKNTLNALLADDNREALRSILAYHVIPGRTFLDDALGSQSVQPLAGPGLAFRIDGGRVGVAGSSVLANDIEASNGVVHAIDSVLLPPGLEIPSGRLMIGFESERPGAALAAQLGLDRDQTLLVTGLTRGDNAVNYGLERYDIITAMNGRPAGEDTLDELKREGGFGSTIRFTVLRAGKTIDLDIPVGLDAH